MRLACRLVRKVCFGVIHRRMSINPLEGQHKFNEKERNLQAQIKKNHAIDGLFWTRTYCWDCCARSNQYNNYYHYTCNKILMWPSLLYIVVHIYIVQWQNNYCVCSINIFSPCITKLDFTFFAFVIFHTSNLIVFHLWQINIQCHVTYTFHAWDTFCV